MRGTLESAKAVPGCVCGIKLFLAMESWMNDNIAFPGEAFRKYAKTCYQENPSC